MTLGAYAWPPWYHDAPRVTTGVFYDLAEDEYVDKHLELQKELPHRVFKYQLSQYRAGATALHNKLNAALAEQHVATNDLNRAIDDGVEADAVAELRAKKASRTRSVKRRRTKLREWHDMGEGKGFITDPEQLFPDVEDADASAAAECMEAAGKASQAVHPDKPLPMTRRMRNFHANRARMQL